MKTSALLALVSPLLVASVNGTEPPPAASPSPSVTIAPDGTATVVRVVPVPTTVSPEAQRALADVKSYADSFKAQTLEQERVETDRWQAEMRDKWLRLYPVELSTDALAGVPVRVVTPGDVVPEKAGRVLINLHGGGFRVDSGSFSETVPIAALTGAKVVSILYRLSPEHAFPAAVDDVVAVYRELLNDHRPADLAMYGTSAGAVLTAEVAARVRQLGLPLPAALGIFSGGGDWSRTGDSETLFDLHGFSERVDPPRPGDVYTGYVGSTDLKDPVLSPAYADLAGFPPTLFVTSTRDVELSSTVNLHRTFLKAGVDAQLVVYEALWHASGTTRTSPNLGKRLG